MTERINGTAVAVLLIIAAGFSGGCGGKRPEDEFSSQKAQIDKLLGFWNTGNFSGIETVLHPDFEMRVSPRFNPRKGLAAFMQSVTRQREAYPDFLITVHEGVFSRDMVAGRWTITATAPDGRKLQVMGLSLLHFMDGKIRDEWIGNNDIEWMTQLGYTLTPPASPAAGQTD